MAITQERMIALLNELDQAMRIIEEVEKVSKAYHKETQDMFAYQIMDLVRGLQTPCFWIERAHFAKNAKANMHRALKHRAERNSPQTRPLLGLRPEKANAQVMAKYRGIDDSYDEARLIIEAATASVENDYLKKQQDIYDAMLKEDPTQDRVKLWEKAKVLATNMPKQEPGQHPDNGEKISDGNLQLPQKLPDGRVQVF
jgi:hypothetical protein